MHLNVYIFVQNGTKQGYRLIENLRAVFGSENVYINVRHSCSLRIEEEVFIFSLIFLEISFCTIAISNIELQLISDTL